MSPSDSEPDPSSSESLVTFNERVDAWLKTYLKDTDDAVDEANSSLRTLVTTTFDIENASGSANFTTKLETSMRASFDWLDLAFSARSQMRRSADLTKVAMDAVLPSSPWLTHHPFLKQALLRELRQEIVGELRREPEGALGLRIDGPAEEGGQDLKHELRSKHVEERRFEIDTELFKYLLSEAQAKFKAELKKQVKAEVRSELKAEPLNELRSELHSTSERGRPKGKERELSAAARVAGSGPGDYLPELLEDVVSFSPVEGQARRRGRRARNASAPGLSRLETNLSAGGRVNQSPALAGSKHARHASMTYGTPRSTRSPLSAQPISQADAERLRYDAEFPSLSPAGSARSVRTADTANAISPLLLSSHGPSIPDPPPSPRIVVSSVDQIDNDAIHERDSWGRFCLLLCLLLLCRVTKGKSEHTSPHRVLKRHAKDVLRRPWRLKWLPGPSHAKSPPAPIENEQIAHTPALADVCRAAETYLMCHPGQKHATMEISWDAVLHARRYCTTLGRKGADREELLFHRLFGCHTEPKLDILIEGLWS